MPASIDLYFWPTPNGQKITIMLEECGLNYRLHPVNISQGEQFKPDFLKISPNGKMPALVDIDGPGQKAIGVFESGAILLYLARKTGRFYSADDPRRQTEIEQWLMWQMAGFGPMLGQAHHFRHYAPEKVPYGITRYSNEAQRLYGVLNKQLETRDFMCGDYSIVDMAILPWASLSERQGVLLDEFPNVKTWVERCLSRPALKKGLEARQELRGK